MAGEAFWRSRRSASIERSIASLTRLASSSCASRAWRFPPGVVFSRQGYVGKGKRGSGWAHLLCGLVRRRPIRRPCAAVLLHAQRAGACDGARHRDGGRQGSAAAAEEEDGLEGDAAAATAASAAAAAVRGSGAR